MWDFHGSVPPATRAFQNNKLELDCCFSTWSCGLYKMPKKKKKKVLFSCSTHTFCAYSKVMYMQLALEELKQNPEKSKSIGKMYGVK